MPKVIPVLFVLAIFFSLSCQVLAYDRVSMDSVCMDGDMRPCGTNIGECEYGVSECVNGNWGVCEGGTEPVPEICANDKDDNCNGIKDECLTEFWPILIILGVMFLVMLMLLMKMGF